MGVSAARRPSLVRYGAGTTVNSMIYPIRCKTRAIRVSSGIMAQLVARILRMDEVASSILADSIFLRVRSRRRPKNLGFFFLLIVYFQCCASMTHSITSWCVLRAKAGVARAFRNVSCIGVALQGFRWGPSLRRRPHDTVGSCRKAHGVLLVLACARLVVPLLFSVQVGAARA